MIRRCLTLVSTAALLASLSLVVAGGATALANTPVNGAAFTTTNTNVDGTGHCKNGNEDVNCNIYDGKEYVWLNGGPVAASLSDGTYFFAVLVPGGQGGNDNPNDGTENNLSDLSPTSNTGAGDAYTNRTFSVSAGTISYSGTHTFDSNKIRLMGYDDTTNPGGVYILAICNLADADANAENPPGVDPSDCKYDAFKVKTGDECTINCGGGGAGLPLSVTKDANGSYDTTYTWTPDKSADTPTVYTAGGADGSADYTVSVSHDAGTVGSVVVTGTIAVFNPNVDVDTNVVPVDINAVTDQLSDLTDCTVTGGGAQTLTAFETDFAYTCSLSGLPQGQLDNTAKVTWSEQFLGTGDLLDAGQGDFTFSDVQFAGNNVDECVDVNDSVHGDLGPVCVGDDNPTTFTYSETVSGDAGTCTDNDNTVTLTTNDTAATPTDSATVSDCQGADLTVTKTANPAYTRTYNWSIRKTVDEASHIDQLGGTVTLHYHVTASETGFTDSGWTVSGTITVTNSNDWEDVTLSDVTDAVDNGGTCTVDKTGGLTVPKSGTKGFPYSCSYASKPTYNVTAHNVATATWDASAASTPTGTADTGNVDFSFTTPTSTTNKTIHVTDTYNGGSPVALGTLTAVDTTPYTTATYNLQKVVTVPTNGTCVTVTNTGTITETGAHSDVSNTICGRAAVGALTMGFWQNKNGQGIITGQAKTGVCPSATWLRTYKPFQDLSATSTCAQVATYVTNVIKAANASGAAMNAMLKAQMLATALDVYFSDSTLGGNKIGAPGAIGGQKVDLTKICKMIDASSGTGSCSGTYSNASAAFGGATCLSVLDILAYESSQSNVGGSTWYAQVKTTQELAKNTDDAINNQVAFAC